MFWCWLLRKVLRPTTFSSATSVPILYALPITLDAGVQYWITISDGLNGADSNFWNWNDTGDPSDEAISTDGGKTWFSPSGLPAGAFEVDGTPVVNGVPEPSSVGLLASGVLAALSWRSRPGRTRRSPAFESRPFPEPLESRVVPTTTINWTQLTTPLNGEGTMLL